MAYSRLFVVSAGIVFHWDAYEIAPYSMGPIDVTVPASELETVLSADYWQKKRPAEAGR